MKPKMKPPSGRAPAFPVRFTAEDLHLLDRLQAKTGAVSRAEVLRRAIRLLAQKEGVHSRGAIRL